MARVSEAALPNRCCSHAALLTPRNLSCMGQAPAGVAHPEQWRGGSLLLSQLLFSGTEFDLVRACDQWPRFHHGMNRCRNSDNDLRFRLFLRPDAPGSKRIWNRCEGRRSTRSGNRHRDTEDTKLREDGEIRVSDLADALKGSFLPAQPFPRLGAPEGCSENVFVPSAKI